MEKKISVIKNTTTGKYFVKLGSFLKKDDVWTDVKSEAIVFDDERELKCLTTSTSLRFRGYKIECESAD